MEAIQKNMAWKAIPVATLVAGTALLLINMIFNPILYEIDALFIIRYFASFVFGTEVLTEASTVQLVVGLIVHYAFSLLFTLVRLLPLGA